MTSSALPDVLSLLHAAAIAVPGTPLRLAGMFNLRDLGGYPTVDGRRTRTGRIFRADSFAFLTDEDQEEIRRLGLALVCDLRTEKELAEAPNKLPAGLRYEHNPMKLNANVMGGKPATLDWSVFTLDHLYIHMLEDSGPTFRRVFARLADPASYPYLFHCMAGKDRTGMTAALVLRAAGVSDETVVADFALSDAHIAPKIPYFLERMRARGVSAAGAEKMLRAPAHAMAAALAHLDARYSSPAGYLASIGVTGEEIEAFRGLFLN